MFSPEDHKEWEKLHDDAPRRRMMHVGVVIVGTGAGEPDEPFDQISPIHHPSSEVQPLSQLRRLECKEAA
jgi:hypothetical protein